MYSVIDILLSYSRYIDRTCNRNILVGGYMDRVKELEKENKALKKLCDKYENEHADQFRIWKEILDEHSREKILIESIKKIMKVKTQGPSWKYYRIAVLVRDFK